MRTYILTEKEREILKVFVESKSQLNGFSVLMLRLKRSKDQLAQDIELIEKALQKVTS
jgi:hypothetical protein